LLYLRSLCSCILIREKKQNVHDKEIYGDKTYNVSLKYTHKVQMPLPGRCMSAGTVVLNYRAANVAPTQKTSRRRGDRIFKRINDLGTNKNLIVGSDGARSQEQLCWRGPARNYYNVLSEFCLYQRGK
jgi:hypothetical protein